MGNFSQSGVSKGAEKKKGGNKMKRKILCVMAMLLAVAVSLSAKILHQSGLPEELDTFLERLEVQGSTHYKNLHIFPVTIEKESPVKNVLSLDEALKKDMLDIYEQGEGDVPEVEVRNHSKSYVFLMAGEIIAGGKQDRMIQKDTLIPPKSKKFKVAVYCTEEGRWEQKTEKFYSPDAVVGMKVKKAAEETKDQGAVWDKVAEYDAGLSTPSPTGAFKGVLDDKDVQKKSKKYVDALEKAPQLSKNTVGVVVAVGDEIITADVFSDAALFKKYWAKLLKSYVLEAIDKDDDGKISRNAAENFLAQAYKADVTEEGNAGSGELYALKSGKITGSALVFNDAVLHMDVFPK